MILAISAARRAAAALMLACLAGLVGAELIRQPSLIRYIAAGCLGLVAIIGTAQWPQAALPVILILLPYLAFFRRLLLEFTPWKSTDPLLLVTPVALMIVVMRLYVIERRPVGSDRISKLMAFVISLTFLEAFNPRGGGLTAGAAALLFTAIPLLWFFVGRELCTARILNVVFATGVASACVIAIYGIYQTWDGLPSWDRLWVDQTGYAALNVGKDIRAFGTFSSAAEYASFLGVAIVVAVSFALDRRPYLIPAVPLLGYALFYESSRGPIVTTIAAVAVVISAKSGSMRRALVVFALCLGALVGGFIFARGDLQTAATSSNPLVSHAAEGLVHPLNAKQSTLPGHFSELTQGLSTGIADPIGFGIASTTSASRLGNPEAASTEVDFSNQFVAEGTFGGLAYLGIILLVLAAAFRTAVARRDGVSLATLGILVALLGQWLNGGYWALAPLVWFMIGYLVKTTCRDTSRRGALAAIHG